MGFVRDLDLAFVRDLGFVRDLYLDLDLALSFDLTQDWDLILGLSRILDFALELLFGFSSSDSEALTLFEGKDLII